MISVQEVITDPDIAAPQPYLVLRSAGQWTSGGFQSTIMQTLQMFGPVQQASNKEIQMLPEADRISSIRSFWSTQPFYVTRGYASVPSVHGETPAGAIPGTVYTLSSAPPTDSAEVYLNGLLQPPGVNYTISGATLTFTVVTPTGASLWAQWPVMAQVGVAASDILQYGDEQYRVLQVYHDAGCGYWKALATRLSAA